MRDLNTRGPTTVRQASTRAWTGLALCLAGLAASSCTNAPLPATALRPSVVGPDYDSYKNACVSAIRGNGGPVMMPDRLQCTEGTVLPITQNDNVIPAQHNSDEHRFTSATQCDRPPLLQLNPKNGQCMPNSTLRVFRVPQEGVDEKDYPYAALLCRNYQFRSADAEKLKPTYDDIAMIVYSPRTTNACFFQKLSDSAAVIRAAAGAEPVVAAVADEALSGANVPSPFSPDASGFWLSPKKMEDLTACTTCHDANPLMRSPYAQQSASGAGYFPARRASQAYGVVGLDYFGEAWRKYHQYFAVSGSDSKTCVTCHSIGPGETSGVFLNYSAGAPAPSQIASAPFDRLHWMPLPLWSGTDQGWHDKYDKSVTKLRVCHDQFSGSKKPDPDCGLTHLLDLYTESGISR